MKIDFKAPILDLAGKVLKNQAGVDFLLEEACTTALLGVNPDERGVSGAEKAARFKLAVRITNAGGEPLDLTPEEVVKLKDVVGAIWPPAVVGPAYEMLDG